MDEQSFIDSFDCRFPFESSLKWRKVVSTATKISPNAVFAVAYELCNPPYSSQIEATKRLEIWRYAENRFRHSLLRPLSKLIESRIIGHHIQPGTAMKMMRVVRPHKNQFSALAICYSACNGRFEEADDLYESIVSGWKNA